MRDRTIVPTNLLDWPRCAGLLPDQRLILFYLWAAPWMTAAGWGAVPITAAAATLGLSPEALTGGLETLDQAGLIAWDPDTHEAAIADWYRFHTFRKGPAAHAAARSVQRIQSQRIKKLILEKSSTYLPTTTTTITNSFCSSAEGPSGPAKGGLTAAAAARKKRGVISGVVCWTDDDIRACSEMVARHGEEAVRAAAEEVRRQGVEPLPSRVEQLLELKESTHEQQQYTPHSINPPRPGGTGDTTTDPLAYYRTMGVLPA